MRVGATRLASECVWMSECARRRRLSLRLSKEEVVGDRDLDGHVG